MQLSWWMTSLSALEIIALAGVVVEILRRKQLGNWPFLWSALAGELLLDLRLAWLLAHPGHYKAYFYTYWIGGAVISCLRQGIFVDLTRSLRVSFLPKNVYLFVAVAGLTMAFASGYYCHNEFAPLATNVRDVAVTWNRSINIFMAVLIAVILCAIKLFNFGWSSSGALVAKGFAVRTIFALLAGEIYSLKIGPITRHIVEVRSFANGLETFCSIAVFSFWVIALTRSQLSERAPEGDTNHGLPITCLMQRR